MSGLSVALAMALVDNRSVAMEAPEFARAAR